MKTSDQLVLNILNITSKINQEYPELSKYIVEIPLKVSKNPTIENKNLKEYYDSLVGILSEYEKTHTVSKSRDDLKQHFSDDLSYPPSEDIYNRSSKEMELNPENTSIKKTPNKNDGLPNEITFKDDMSGSDLDVPGAELDDKQESIGIEDEENNYYSLGGDNHSNLDEN